MIRAVLVFLDGLVLGHAVRYTQARRRTEKCRHRRDSEFCEQVTQRMALATVLDDPDLDRFEEWERRRGESVKSRAQTNLISISLASALSVILLGAGREALSVGTDDSIPLRIGYGLLVLGWLYLVRGGHFAFKTLNVREVYVISPKEEATLDAGRLRATRLFYLEQNQLFTRVMTNALAVSFASIRNGIAMFAIGIILIALEILV